MKTKTIRLTVEFLFEVPESTNLETVSLGELLQGEDVFQPAPNVELLQYETTYVENEE